MTDDPPFGRVISEHVRPEYFEHPPLAWMASVLREHVEQYGRPPSELVYETKLRDLPPEQSQLYAPTVSEFRKLQVPDGGWIRDTATEWAKQQVFARAIRDSASLYNAGKHSDAYDRMMRAMDEIHRQSAEAEAESWFFEEFSERQVGRNQNLTGSRYIGTGIPTLDNVMGGGLAPGQFGIWMAYSKVGKSTMLANLGAVAVRAYYRNVTHFVLEDDLRLIADKYDTIFSGATYNAVKKGEVDESRYAQLMEEYQFLRRKLYLKKFEWGTTTVKDLHATIRDLRTKHGWSPEMVVVDYADLLRGSLTSHDDKWSSEAEAYAELKTLSTSDHGYAIWSAAQAKKPKDPNYDTRPHELKSSEIGGRYEKVKVANFLASLNATRQEREEGWLRIWVEATREGKGGALITVPVDFERMLFGQRLFRERSQIPEVRWGSATNAEAPVHRQSDGVMYRQVPPHMVR